MYDHVVYYRFSNIYSTNTNSVGIMYKVLLYIIWGIYILNNMYELSVHFISERFLYQFVYDFYLNIHILCSK